MTIINNTKPKEEVKLTNEELMHWYIEHIELFLSDYIKDDDKDTKRLSEAMRYSLLAGGKRIRPVLALDFYKIASGGLDCSHRVMSYAMAVELIHTYSLIHDDLPCMDDDDLRRGLPTNHTVFGEATALLAGDALLTEAFTLLADTATGRPHESEATVKAITYLSKCAGYRGMCGGQELDLKFETAVEPPSEETILKMYGKKTSDLLSAACAIGCIAAKRYDLVDEAAAFGKNLGLAFQITDDILDVVGDEQKLGKPIGSDEENDKYTYLKAVGIEKAKEMAAFYLEEAKRSIARFNNNEFLYWLCDKILERDH
ncbi:MAG: polyprenyl synthetase family protein [Clostridia bacterium]|nr:polyprenyl synthetase family protein [Clostridia bacterium]MBR2327991.1 polyprenyl synthetase family protein [Clostridia bacterium]